MAAPDVFGELDAALYARLTGDSALMALVSSVWQEVAWTDNANTPPTTPYVIVSQVTSVGDDYANRTVDICTTDVKVIDDASYPARGEAAAAEVMRLLHDKPLTTASFANTGLWRTNRRRFRDDAGFWNIIMSFAVRMSIAA